MGQRFNDETLAQLFNQARTHNAWLAKDVPDALLADVVNLMKMGPTSANCSPARIVFVKSEAGKEKLRPCLSPGNVEKTMAAPVTAIIGYDLAFYNLLPRLFPHADAKSWFVGKDEHIRSTAFRNGSLQGAYFMLAARAVGLDIGAMSGFDADAVEAQFFAGTTVRSNFLCNVGYGDSTGLFARSPRLDFDEIATIV